MVDIFGDESADETKERVFAVAVVLGRVENWERAEAQWISTIGSDREFHAADWESEFSDDPSDPRHAKNLETYKRLVHVLIDNGLSGYGLGVDLGAWRDVWKPLGGMVPGIEYHKCFVDVVHYVTTRLKEHGISDDVQFTFDHRQESEYNTGRLYDQFVRQKEWREGHLFLRTKVSFDSIQNPRIQMADLLARETMKGLDNEIGPIKRSRRKSLIALGSANGRFQFDYYVREYFESWASQLTDLEKSTGISRERIANWLKERNLPNTISSLVSFLIWANSQDGLT